MTKYYSAKIETKDAKDGKSRRFRNILANSGEIMESGEIREIDDLYVMGYDGELYKISDLAKNPDKQTERYAVKAQADHGELIDGELVPSIEKQFGSCKVWTDDDGLHARMYFADDDTLADHAWAISEDASYSTGIDWFPDGYYGAGHEITEPIGILREISMVLTGNDPRAKTIDAKKDGANGDDMVAKSDDSVKNNFKKGKEMNKKLDELTPDENRAIKEALSSVVDRFTTDAPESETEPTARDTKDSEGETAPAEGDKAEAPAEKTNDNIKHMPVVVIKDRSPAKQEKTTDSTKKDWRLTDSAKQTFSKLAGQFKRFDSNFSAAWNAELNKHGATTNDGITGLALPTDTRKILIDAVTAGEDDSVRILNWCEQVGGRSLPINLIDVAGEATAETSRAHGHKKGDTKIFQELAASDRTIYNKMVYKMLDLDAMEVYENPELVEFRARELVRALLAEYARSIAIGDGRSAPTQGQPDYRTFDGTRGFYSILADAKAASGVGSEMAKMVNVAATKNLYDASIEATGAIDAPGALMYIVKKSVVTAYRQATKANGDYVVAPGASIEASLGAAEIVAPKWMDYADVDAIVVARNAYKLIGEANPTMRPDFDITKNQDVLLAEAPRGGSLGERNSAVAIKFGNDESES